MEFQGLATIGNTFCSVLQGLMAAEHFVDDLCAFCEAAHQSGIATEEVMPLSSAFVHLGMMRFARPSQLKMALLEKVKNAAETWFIIDQDAQKFLENFLRQIHTECLAALGRDKTIGGKRNPVEENFYISQRYTSFCESCFDFSSAKGRQMLLSICEKKQPNQTWKDVMGEPLYDLQILLDQIYKKEEGMVQCGACSIERAHTMLEITKLPKYLILFVKRYADDSEDTIKPNEKVRAPKFLSMIEYCREEIVLHPDSTETPEPRNPSDAGNAAAVTANAGNAAAVAANVGNVAAVAANAGNAAAVAANTSEHLLQTVNGERGNESTENEDCVADSVPSLSDNANDNDEDNINEWEDDSDVLDSGSEYTLASSDISFYGGQSFYRLVAAITHVAASVGSGHHICNAWSSTEKKWLHCIDDMVVPISEEFVMRMNDAGCIYFYIRNDFVDEGTEEEEDDDNEYPDELFGCHKTND